MKTTTWSVAVLFGFTALSVTHCNIARALTYEETVCVSEAWGKGVDPKACFGTGGDGGGAGSGGSGSADGGYSAYSERWGRELSSASCTAPSFWFTGPIDQSNMSVHYEMNQKIRIFTRTIAGTTYEYEQKYEEKYDASWNMTGVTYTWTVTALDPILNTSRTSTCNVSP